MKQLFYISLLIIFCCSLGSCKSYFLDIALRSAGVYEEKTAPAVYSNNEKTVVMIGMHHIGKQSFYDDVKHKVDSLRSLGFHFMYESVSYDADFPQEQRKEYEMKFRKLMGFHLTGQGYLDTETNKVLGKIKVKKKHGLINQPKPDALGLNTSVDEKADLPQNILVDKYEAKFGAIVLDKCDYETALEEKYKCAVWENGNKDYVIITVRDKELSDRILNSENDKIAVIYGKSHIDGVLSILQQNNADWKKVNINR